MEGDDERHRREEQERRAKRKASKASKSKSQLEKELKQKEHRQRVLKEHGATGASGGSSSSRAAATSTSAGAPKATVELTKSVFQELFSQRASGFQVDFRFRNAPPRPPVGPTFVGYSLDSMLAEQCGRYKPLNAVEVMHKWRLHSESDVGVPLAPSAMDLKSYDPEHVVGGSASARDPRLHPDDAEILDWAGSMGDTAAEQLKLEQERKRIKERQMLTGKVRSPTAGIPGQLSSLFMGIPSSSARGGQPQTAKKAFSRVLNEGMQTWMKKTTYLSNDYTRKVHDFKSLAQTKQELAQDLRHKQDEMTKRRSAASVSKGFAPLVVSTLKHPTRPNLKPKNVFRLLPDVDVWGASVTHVVIDKPPAPAASDSVGGLVERLHESFVGNVERHPAKARMSCQLFVPSVEKEDPEGEPSKDKATSGDADESASKRYDAARAYDLDVVPLKEEDAPYSNFVLLVDRESNVVTYLPIASRVQLSRGRPVRAPGGFCRISKRPLTNDEAAEREERAAEVNPALSEKLGIRMGDYRSWSLSASASRKRPRTSSAPTADGDEREARMSNGAVPSTSIGRSGGGKDGDDDDGEGDFGDDDSSSSDSGDDGMFGTAAKTIVAEG